MKQMNPLKCIAAALACVALPAGPAAADIISINANILGENNTDGGNGRIAVSVFGGDFAAEGVDVGVNPGSVSDSGVLDYAFYNNATEAGNAVGTPYAEGASSRIGAINVLQSDDGSGDNVIDLFITTGPGFGGTPDFAGGAVTGGTTARFTEANADIDISGLTSGTVYALFSTNNNGGGSHDAILTASLDGAVEEQLIFNDAGYGGVAGTGVFDNNRYFAAAGIQFDNADGANSTLNVDFFLTGSQGVSFNAAGDPLNGDGDVIGPQGGGRSRFAGLVLVAVPEPSTVALLGVASLFGLTGRRMRY